MRIARIPQMFIYVSAVLTLASSAMPARAATNYTACFAPATIKINLHESSCMSGSGWVKLLSYSMQNPPASSGKNGQAKAPSLPVATSVMAAHCGHHPTSRLQHMQMLLSKKS